MKAKSMKKLLLMVFLILCSLIFVFPFYNVIIDAGETRYWVRKIDRLQSDDTDFLQKLKAEISAFLHFLQHRTLSLSLIHI